MGPRMRGNMARAQNEESHPEDGVDNAFLKVGELVDHYEIERRIGLGGMAEVYLARDTKLGRKVALKVVTAVTGSHSTTLDRFMLEARITARFNHPNIVTIYGVGEHKGLPYLVLEYLEGESLSKRMEERRHTVYESLRLVLAVAEALAEAHSHDVLHRDLKPGNVMLPEDGCPRVVDFGVAKALGELIRPNGPEGDGPEASDWYEMIATSRTGTPRFMAPEQWLGLTETPATDIWALGIILYGLLVGRHPYGRLEGVTLYGMVCSAMAAPRLPARARFEPKLSDLVAQCLSKDPLQRPSARDLIESLEGAIAEQSAWKLEREAAPLNRPKRVVPPQLKVEKPAQGDRFVTSAVVSIIEPQVGSHEDDVSSAHLPQETTRILRSSKQSGACWARSVPDNVTQARKA